MVFDLLCPDSFEYVSGMYSQINEGRDLGRVPVVVVGNKVTFINYVESFLVHYPPAGPVRPWDPVNDQSFILTFGRIPKPKPNIEIFLNC